MMIGINVQLLLLTMKEDVLFWTLKLPLIMQCRPAILFSSHVSLYFQAPEHNVGE